MMMMSSRALKGERPAEGIKIDGGTFIASNITIVTITLKIWPGYNTGNITMMVPQISTDGDVADGDVAGDDAGG